MKHKDPVIGTRIAVLCVLQFSPRYFRFSEVGLESRPFRRLSTRLSLWIICLRFGIDIPGASSDYLTVVTIAYTFLIRSIGATSQDFGFQSSAFRVSSLHSQRVIQWSSGVRARVSYYDFVLSCVPIQIPIVIFRKGKSLDIFLRQFGEGIRYIRFRIARRIWIFRCRVECRHFVVDITLDSIVTTRFSRITARSTTTPEFVHCHDKAILNYTEVNFNAWECDYAC